VNGVCHNTYFWWIDPHAVVETVYVLYPLKLCVQGGWSSFTSVCTHAMHAVWECEFRRRIIANGSCVFWRLVHGKNHVTWFCTLENLKKVY